MTELGKSLIQEGIEKGRAQGKEEGRAQGKEEGRAQGKEEGRVLGKEEGREEGKAEMVIKLLMKKLKKLPDEYKEKIKGLSEDTLDTIALDIFEISSVEELKQYF